MLYCHRFVGYSLYSAFYELKTTSQAEAESLSSRQDCYVNNKWSFVKNEK